MCAAGVRQRLQGEGLTGAVAGPQLLHGLQHVLVDLGGVEDRVVAVLGIVSWAGVVQVWPQAVQGEPLGPAELTLLCMFPLQ